MGSPVRASLGLFFGVLAACGPAGPKAQRYDLTGQVLAVRAETRELLIKHEDIPKFMPAMTMPYKVRDQDLMNAARPGDLVKATLFVDDSEAWLAAIVKTGSAPLAEVAASAFPVSGTDLRQAGDLAPDVALTDQDGRPMTLADWRGDVVAITFIYTRCPLPQFCPMLDRRFAEVQRLAQNDRRLSGRVRLLSVSFDPDVDTPAQLKAHAEKLQADPLVWRFATAPRERVDRLAAQFGVNVIREADGTITHNMRTVVIGPNGTIVTVRDGAEWTSSLLVDDLRNALVDH